MDLEEWDPHSGYISTAAAKSSENGFRDFITMVKLDLKPYRSCFLVEGEAGSRSVIGNYVHTSYRCINAISLIS